MKNISAPVGGNNVIDNIVARFDRIYDKLTPKFFYPSLLVLLVVAGSVVLLMPGMPNGHDLYYHMTRLDSMASALRCGEIPSMINHRAIGNYGYATGLFYPDLFLYPAVVLMLCGLNIVTAYKCLVFFWLIFVAVGAYYCAYRIVNSHFGAFCAALLYVWSSYMSVDLFTRAALGEFLSFAFFPFVILGLYEIIFGDPRKFYYFSIGFLGILYSHNFSLVIVAFPMAVIIILNAVRLLKEPRRMFFLFISPLPVILVGMAALVPMLEQFAHYKFMINAEKNEDIVSRCMPFLKLFLEIPQSKQIPWFPSGIGTIFVITAIQRFRIVSKRSAVEIFRDIMLIAGAGSLLMATDMPVWKGAFKPLAIIQFPWRFFFPATGFLAFGAALTLASLVGADRRRERYWLWIVIAGCAFSWHINTFYYYAAKISERAIIRGAVSGRPQEASGLHYLLLGSPLDVDLKKRGDVVISEFPVDWRLSHPRDHILQIDFKGNRNNNLLECPKVPYYGYRALLKLPDGSRRYLATGVSRQKLLTVSLPKDYSSGTIIVRYHATKLQRISQIVSILSAVVFILYLRGFFRKKPDRTGIPS